MSELALTLRDWSRTRAHLFGLGFVSNALILLVPILSSLTNLFLFQRLPHAELEPLFGEFVEIISTTLPIGLAIAVIIRFFQHALVNDMQSPISTMARESWDFVKSPSKVTNTLIVIFAITLSSKANLDVHEHLPELNPYKWDTTFMQVDRWLHFGIDPWRILQPVMGHDYVTFLASLIYSFWFFALFGTLMWFAVDHDKGPLRTQFFLAFFLIWWIGGSLLAVGFSAAGPAFFGRLLLSADPYGPLMLYLRHVDTHLPLWSIPTQDLLWDGYLKKIEPIGISAFPSMHNANAVLWALTFWRINKLLGWLFTFFAVAIFASSVHLAWHYAIDGYTAIVVACVMWWLAGKLTAFAERRFALSRRAEGGLSLVS